MRKFLSLMLFLMIVLSVLPAVHAESTVFALDKCLKKIKLKNGGKQYVQ